MAIIQVDQELEDLIGSIRNRCDIARLLMLQERVDLLPTVLEDLYGDAQKIVLEYCTAGSGDGG